MLPYNDYYVLKYVSIKDKMTVLIEKKNYFLDNVWCRYAQFLVKIFENVSYFYYGTNLFKYNSSIKSHSRPDAFK